MHCHFEQKSAVVRYDGGGGNFFLLCRDSNPGLPIAYYTYGRAALKYENRRRWDDYKINGLNYSGISKKGHQQWSDTAFSQPRENFSTQSVSSHTERPALGTYIISAHFNRCCLQFLKEEPGACGSYKADPLDQKHLFGRYIYKNCRIPSNSKA